MKNGFWEQFKWWLIIGGILLLVVLVFGISYRYSVVSRLTESLKSKPISKTDDEEDAKLPVLTPDQKNALVENLKTIINNCRGKVSLLFPEGNIESQLTQCSNFSNLIILLTKIDGNSVTSVPEINVYRFSKMPHGKFNVLLYRKNSGSFSDECKPLTNRFFDYIDLTDEQRLDIFGDDIWDGLSKLQESIEKLQRYKAILQK